MEATACILGLADQVYESIEYNNVYLKASNFVYSHSPNDRHFVDLIIMVVIRQRRPPAAPSLEI